MTKLIITAALAACSLIADSNVLPARVLKHTNPDKKTLSTSIRSNGTVGLELTLTEQGKIRKVNVLNGRADLVSAAVQAVRQWDFAPAMVDGRAVPSRIEVSLNFEFAN